MAKMRERDPAGAHDTSAALIDVAGCEFAEE
jgi:hypothetical protein